MENFVKNNIKKGKFKIVTWGVCPKCPAVATPLGIISDGNFFFLKKGFKKMKAYLYT
jgi:hypothetical protein